MEAQMNENFGTFPGGVKRPHPAARSFIYKTRSGKNVIARKPVMDTSHGGPKKSVQEEVRQAVTYAEFACDQALYQSRAVGSSNTAYNLAVADALGKPQVLHIDINSLTGKAEQAILIKAKDNFMVLSVRLVIREGDNILEEGEAEQLQSDGLIWKYTLKTPVERKTGLSLDAYAFDLPGNVGKYSIEVK
jgi:hypothetical protein